MRHFLFLAILLAGCGGPGRVDPADLIQPRVNLRSLAVRNVGLTGGTLEVGLAFYNPNRLTLNGSALRAGLDVEGTRFGDVALAGPFSLEKSDTTVVTVPLAFSWSGVGSAARSVLNSGAVNYGIDGRFTLRLPAGAELEIPFTGQGSIPLLRP
jgi:hypothetical protein